MAPLDGGKSYADRNDVSSSPSTSGSLSLPRATYLSRWHKKKKKNLRRGFPTARVWPSNASLHPSSAVDGTWGIRTFGATPSLIVMLVPTDP